MAYDEELAERVREVVDVHDAVERKMFGGLAFMIGGNMACCVMSEARLLVRVGDDRDKALEEPHTDTFGMPGRKPMSGFVVVDPAGLESDEELASWVDAGIAFASTLPPK